MSVRTKEIQLEREKMWLDLLRDGGHNVAEVLKDNPIAVGLVAMAANWGLYKLGFWDMRPELTETKVRVGEVGHWEYRPDPGEIKRPVAGPGGFAFLPGPLYDESGNLLSGVDPRTRELDTTNSAGGHQYVVPVDRPDGETVGLVVPAPGGLEGPGLSGGERSSSDKTTSMNYPGFGNLDVW